LSELLLVTESDTIGIGRDTVTSNFPDSILYVPIMSPVILLYLRVELSRILM